MSVQKNYIDAKGNYHNVENLTLTQIHDRASEEGYRLGMTEGLKTVIEGSDILPQLVEIIRDILPQLVEIAKEKMKEINEPRACYNCKHNDKAFYSSPCNVCGDNLNCWEKDSQAGQQNETK